MSAAAEADALRRAEARRDSAAARVEEFRAGAAALEAAKPDPEDIDACLAFEERAAAAAARVRIATRALELAETAVASAKTEASERNAKARHAAAQKAARQAERLITEYERWARTGVDLLSRIEAHRIEIADINNDLGRRYGWIADAEERVRQTAAREVSEVREGTDVWVDSEGHQRGQYRPQPDGTCIGMDGSPLRRSTVEYVVRPAYLEPARMPPRLAEAVVLPALDGGALWPPR